MYAEKKDVFFLLLGANHRKFLLKKYKVTFLLKNVTILSMYC